MTTWFDPDDLWPEHAKAFWRASLRAAKEAGWRLKYLDAPHVYGEVYCPTGKHWKKVDKTSSDSDTHAVELAKKVRRCRCTRVVSPEGPEPAATLAPGWAQGQITRIEDLLGHVADGLLRLEYAIEARECLDRALDLETEMDVIEGLLQRAAEAEAEAPSFGEVESSLAEGLASLDRVGPAAPDAPGLADLRERHRTLSGQFADLKERTRRAES